MLISMKQTRLRVRKARCASRARSAGPGGPYAGTHLLLEIWGATRLDHEPTIRRMLTEAVAACRACLLSIELHRFSPFDGISGVAIIAESHISIHTWPELGYAAMDIFMCGAARPRPAIAVIRKHLRPSRVQQLELKRGNRRRPFQPSSRA